MPDTFIDFKEAALPLGLWVYMQILRHHAGSLFSKSTLTSGQRYLLSRRLAAVDCRRLQSDFQPRSDRLVDCDGGVAATTSIRR